MEKAKLLTLLGELHAELASADELDPDTRQAVAALASDAQRLLEDKAEEPAPGNPDASPTMAEQFRARLREFGADHPALSKALNQVADGLSGLGI